MPVRLRQARAGDVDTLAPLFDAYRQFYGQAPDLALAHRFLAERLGRLESVVFLATGEADEALGFTQLFPVFSSVRARRTYTLNDLFVVPEARRRGVALRLLEAAAAFGREQGAARLSLATALDNIPAQRLYESLGWKRDEAFCHYHLAL
ncbi:GNAT family N-acetyltransferase [Solimonas sp. K1W22B-7]|uniref:GNAT family N-acetyltransferase n=1 Tax=Solimonas sp. K1W22B-7 TaxID=2303331 RepID=UPI000E32FD18|nr:GNAT family N-acetyltransferase [Solimonas sp. K1W22B-7]AXQ31446.1 GNAT family N-acetyltransferase [Solimonas sp. K1W22B-7]